MIVYCPSLKTQTADLSTVTASTDPTQSTPHCDLWSAESKECFSAQFAESIGSRGNKGRGIKKTADQ